MARIKTKHKSSGKKPASGVSRRTKLLLPRTRVLVALAVVGLLGWGMQSLWQQVAPSVIQRNQHLLQAERITSTSLPAWISAEVCAEVVRNAGLDGRLSLLDDAFSQVIEDAFVLHPWVSSVERITKQYPQGVHVELTYRRPVAVVEMSGREGVLFVPIDRHGVHLPPGDVPELRKRYMPRIGGIVGRPPVGQAWPDPRVIGAAELAEKLREQWEPLCLVDILPSARPEIRDGSRFFVYDLITRGGTRVVWGAAPGTAPPKEDPFDAKLTRLQDCVEKHGPVDSVRGPAIVDVRGALAITPRTVKKPPAAGKDPRTAKTPPDDDAPVIQ
jgi:hypothetical protein